MCRHATIERKRTNETVFSELIVEDVLDVVLPFVGGEYVENLKSFVNDCHKMGGMYIQYEEDSNPLSWRAATFPCG